MPDDSIEIQIYLHEDPRCVAMIVKGAAIIEDTDGDLVPVVGMSAAEARSTAAALLELADILE